MKNCESISIEDFNSCLIHFKYIINGDFGHLGEAAVKLVGKVEFEQEVEVVTINHLSKEGRNLIL